MSPRFAIHGVGHSAFGRQPAGALADLAEEAVSGALADSGGDPVDAVFAGSVFAAPGGAQRLLGAVGLGGVPVVTIENACASGTSALHEAGEAVRLGRCERALAIGFEQLSTQFDGPIVPEASDPEGRAGLALPALYAMAASRYLHEGRVTREQLAAVTVKNRGNGARNPRAYLRTPVTAAEVCASRPIAEPLRLLDCCPLSDGVAAAVVGPERRGSRCVEVLGSTHRAGGAWDHESEHVWGYGLVAETAAATFEQAGVGPDDLDLAEVHDAFTIGELISIEALGIAPEGEGGAFVGAGAGAIDGDCAVNPSGGLLSRGHPLGATGLAQVAEVVWQLRGEADGRQVEGARLGLVETMGGGVAGSDGNACVVMVMS